MTEWKLAPVEPDAAMMKALADCAQRITITDEDSDGDEWKATAFNGLTMFRAMLSAAPSPVDEVETVAVARAIWDQHRSVFPNDTLIRGEFGANEDELGFLYTRFRRYALAAISALRQRAAMDDLLRMDDELYDVPEGECHCPEHGSWVSKTDQDRLVRELDVLLNGEHGAAKQASLCDIVSQVASEKLSLYRGPQPPKLSEEERARVEEVRGWVTRNEKSYDAGRLSDQDADWAFEYLTEALSLIDKLTESG